MASAPIRKLPVASSTNASTAGPRPLDRLLADARRGKFDVVMVWRFDRLSRSALHFLEIIEELRSLGVDFVSHEQALDTTSSMGKFVLTMFAGLAELERQVIRERVRAGLQYARRHGTKSGKPIGRPRRVFDREQAGRLSAQGASLRQIAGTLNVGYGTVCRALRDTEASLGRSKTPQRIRV